MDLIGGEYRATMRAFDGSTFEVDWCRLPEDCEVFEGPTPFRSATYDEYRPYDTGAIGEIPEYRFATSQHRTLPSRLCHDCFVGAADWFENGWPDWAPPVVLEPDGWPSECTGGAMGVQSVGLALPSEFVVTGSPVTSIGVLSGDWVDQPANMVFAGPPSGADARPEFRALEVPDLPVGYPWSWIAGTPAEETVAWVLVDEWSGGPSAHVDFFNLDTYDGPIFIELEQVVTDTSTFADLCCRLSLNGSTFDSGATDYRYATTIYSDDNTTATRHSTGDSLIKLTGTFERVSGLVSPHSKLNDPCIQVDARLCEFMNTPLSRVSMSQGVRYGSFIYGPIKGIRFLCSDGSNLYGRIRVYASKLLPWANVPGVTSVGCTVPDWLDVTGVPIDSAGTIAIAPASGKPKRSFLATPPSVNGPVGLREIVPTDLGDGTPDATKVLWGDGEWRPSSSGGSVTSVGLAAPLWFTVVGSPVTGAGTLQLTLTPGIGPNQFLATPGDATGPVGLRYIVPLDLGLTAVGDMLYVGIGISGLHLGRVPIGDEGQVLTVVAGKPEWADSGGSGSGVARWVRYDLTFEDIVAETVIYEGDGLSVVFGCAARVDTPISQGGPTGTQIPFYVESAQIHTPTLTRIDGGPYFSSGGGVSMYFPSPEQGSYPNFGVSQGTNYVHQVYVRKQNTFDPDPDEGVFTVWLYLGTLP